MRLYFFSFLIIVISFGNLYSQEGSKIDLKNVNVGTKRLPTIFLFGEEFTARDRDDLLKGVLKSQFYRPDLQIIINLQEFISKRSFSFRHKGPIDVIINGKKLRNQNGYNTASTYGQGGDSQLLKLINKVKNVRIDSNLNGILERRALKREIISIDKEIKKLMEDIKAEVKVDTIVIPDKTSKKKERELNKLYRIKNRQEKRFNETQLIEINIITN